MSPSPSPSNQANEKKVGRTYIGIAISSGRGLVVPVLRHAERLSFAEIEAAIAALAQKSDPGHLTGEALNVVESGSIEDLRGSRPSDSTRRLGSTGICTEDAISAVETGDSYPTSLPRSW